MNDTPSSISLYASWKGFGRSTAVAAGALTSLTGLFFHVPLSAACLRGALVWAAILVVTRGAIFAAERIDRGRQKEVA